MLIEARNYDGCLVIMDSLYELQAYGGAGMSVGASAPPPTGAIVYGGAGAGSEITVDAAAPTTTIQASPSQVHEVVIALRPCSRRLN